MKESKFQKYIYINEETNIIHIMAPIVSGHGISVDNTCQTMACLRSFCGSNGIMAELESYKSNLEADIKSLYASDPLLKAKQNRLLQIENYMAVIPSIIDSIKNQPVNGTPNTNLFQLPDMILSIMNSSTDGAAILLSPFAADSSVRLRKYAFSLEQDRENGCFTNTLKESLQSKIQVDYPPPTQSVKNIIQNAINEFKEANGENVTVNSDEMLSEFKEILQRHISLVSGTKTDLDSKSRYEDFQQLLMFDKPDEVPLEEWGQTLINDARIDENHLSRNQPNSSFILKYAPNSSSSNIKVTQALYLNSINQKVQFLLAHANVYCKSNNLSAVNFGKVLEDNPAITNEITDTLSDAINTSNAHDLESKVLSVINSHLQKFGIAEALTEPQIAGIIDMCLKNYEVVKNSPHFDEFFIVDYENEGNLFCHRGCICFDIAKLTLENRILVDPAQKTFLDTVFQDSIQISKKSRILNGVNNIVESVKPVKNELDRHSQGNNKFRP
ncbi:MAG: hypothetical protein U1E78_06965 [Gammaproteobacteria bacterium]